MESVCADAVNATRADFAEIRSSSQAFWGERDVAHLHHPMFIEEFGDCALVVRDPDGRVAAYLFGMVVAAQRLGYVHVVAVREDRRGRGLGRGLYEAFSVLALERGCTWIKAITTPANEGSVAFHRSMGMDADPVSDYSGPGEPRIVFTRQLDVTGNLARPPVPGATVRLATHADVDEVLAFWSVAAEDSDRPVDRREAVQRLIARDPDALLLVVASDGIVGCVAMGWDGWRAHIYRLAVHPDQRRRGLGRWLLELAEQRLRAGGAIRIDAMVLDANASAHELWSAAGYTRQQNWSRWVKPLAPACA